MRHNFLLISLLILAIQAAKSCNPPQVLRNGKCVTVLPVDCPPENRNSKCFVTPAECVKLPGIVQNGRCVRDNCKNGLRLIQGKCSCPPGTKLKGKKCVRACAKGTRLVNGRCIAGAACSNGKILVNGVCKVGECKKPRELINGKCRCRNGEWENNMCVDTNPKGDDWGAWGTPKKKCTGKRCRSNKSKPKKPKTKPKSKPKKPKSKPKKPKSKPKKQKKPKKEKKEKKQKEKKPKIQTCPYGTRLQNGVCIRELLVVCPPGTAMMNGQCLKQAQCPPGTFLNGDICSPIQIDPRNCPPGSQFDGSACVRTEILREAQQVRRLHERIRTILPSLHSFVKRKQRCCGISSNSHCCQQSYEESAGHAGTRRSRATVRELSRRMRRLSRRLERQHTVKHLFTRQQDLDRNLFHRLVDEI